MGLPLDRIAELIDGTEPALHDALDALDAELAAQAERIAAHRAGWRSCGPAARIRSCPNRWR
jgi:hypothetical protein